MHIQILQAIFRYKFPFWISKIIFLWIGFSLIFPIVCWCQLWFCIDFDFMLYYNLLQCFIPLEMRVRLICAIKFYLLTYLIFGTLSFLIQAAVYNTPPPRLPPLGHRSSLAGSETRCAPSHSPAQYPRARVPICRSRVLLCYIHALNHLPPLCPPSK